MIDYRVTHKFASALLVAAYSSEVSYSDLRKHYDVELKKHGWVYKKEQSETTQGQEVSGAKLCYYQKDSYKLTLYYTGNQKNFDYSIALGWGLD